ncbi:MAG: tetratricopeptide repeat protein, partial [Bacteroidetes bacterium]|nr:tetratricopeptide repeat protein [Bacteroidota bacterium]
MANALVRLSNEYSASDFEKAMGYGIKGLELSKKIGFIKGIAQSYNNIGVTYYFHGKYSQALESYLKSLKINEKAGNLKGISDCYNNIGAVNYEQGDYP